MESTTWHAQCRDITEGKTPFAFSARVTIEEYNSNSAVLSINEFAFLAKSNITIYPMEPALFPIGGVLFDDDAVDLAEFSHLALEEVPLQKHLQNLSDFLGHIPNIIAVPDRNTHIIAVLGPSNLADEKNEWQAADFALFYQAFGGIGLSEKWLTPTDLHQHVEKNGDLIHGSSQKPRRIVVDKDSPVFYRVERNVSQAFAAAIQNTVREAQPDQRIVVVICAHGSQEAAIQLGNSPFRKCTLENLLWPTKAPVTIITTACFSGLWAVPHSSLLSQKLVTTLAATTADNPSYSFPVSASERIRGGRFADAVVSEMEAFAEPTTEPPTLPPTLPPTCQLDVLEKVLDLRTFNSTTASRATSTKFSAFALAVSRSLTNSGGYHPEPTVYLALQDRDSSVTTVIGYEDDIGLLYRLSALKELPTKANYDAIPLAVDQVKPRVLTGGIVSKRALERAEYYWSEFHPPTNPDTLNLVPPWNLGLANGTRLLRQNKLDSTKALQFLTKLNARIDLDTQASYLAAHITRCSGSTSLDPSLTLAQWDSSHWNVNGEIKYEKDNGANLIGYFWDLQPRLSPVWDNCAFYERPATFLAVVASKSGYRTRAEVKPIVEKFFLPPRTTSISNSISLPNMNIDDCLAQLRSSLTAVSLS
ncbi:hypothetical protein D9757_000427 [Collybiopsis confluens]|uniref:Uncharacterized protein n=1 Tax=Collybiopsis confluens TaxID=2823264 RepID=A0A8H5MHC9_9AGAR|nr:hypothetical protein D9757_000427 [Collybiopsis confluens]